MVVRSSSARQIDTLIADLRSAGSIEREAAVARLILIGERAVERLIPVLADGETAAAAAALAALEAIADPRALEPILAAIDRGDVAAAAVQAARPFLTGSHGARALDRLTGVLLDPARPDAPRIAAFHALAGLGARTTKPLLAELAADPSTAVRALALPAAAPGVAAAAAPAVLGRAAGSELPADPDALRQAIVAAGAGAPLTALLDIVERVREREAAASGPEREPWTRVRGAAHAALAARDSRLALYDLRESIDQAAEPLPVEFLAALSRIGDASCLEAIAAAWRRGSAASRRDWWHDHLAEAFRSIVKREKITRRHAVVRKIDQKHGLAGLWPEAGTPRPRSS